MSIFPATLTEDNLLTLSTIVGMNITGVALQAINILYLEPNQIRNFLDKIDAAGSDPAYDQGEIADLYLRVSDAWNAYEDSMGLVDANSIDHGFN